jgi:hypothetical protein
MRPSGLLSASMSKNTRGLAIVATARSGRRVSGKAGVWWRKWACCDVVCGLWSVMVGQNSCAHARTRCRSRVTE